MSLARTIMSNMAAVALGKAINALFGIAMVALLTRHLGPEGFGHYRTALTYLSLASIVANLGLYMVVLREISVEGADRAAILGNALSLRLAAALTAMLVASGLAVLLPYGAVVVIGIAIGALGYVAAQGTEIMTAIFQRFLAQRRVAVAEVCGTFVALALMAGFACAGTEVLAMLTAFSAGTMVTFALSWRLALTFVSFRPLVHWSVWRSLLAAGLPIAGSEVLIVITLRGDTLILSLLKPASDVGLYGLATRMFELLIALLEAFPALMMPIFVKYAN